MGGRDQFFTCKKKAEHNATHAVFYFVKYLLCDSTCWTSGSHENEDMKHMKTAPENKNAKTREAWNDVQSTMVSSTFRKSRYIK